MTPDALDDLLNAYAKQPLPPPSEGNAAIWQRIDAQRRKRRAWSNLFPVVSWRELFAEPRLAIAGLALAVVTGIVPVATAAALVETPRIARESLHLDVFTTCPSCMPMQMVTTSTRR